MRLAESARISICRAPCAPTGTSKRQQMQVPEKGLTDLNRHCLKPENPGTSAITKRKCPAKAGHFLTIARQVRSGSAAASLDFALHADHATRIGTLVHDDDLGTLEEVEVIALAQVYAPIMRPTIRSPICNSGNMMFSSMTSIESQVGPDRTLETVRLPDAAR